MTTLDNLRKTMLNGTSSATIGTETTHAHALIGANITDVQIVATANGVVYLSRAYPSADNTNIYVKGGAASLTFTAVIWYYGGQG